MYVIPMCYCMTRLYYFQLYLSRLYLVNMKLYTIHILSEQFKNIKSMHTNIQSLYNNIKRTRFKFLVKDKLNRLKLASNDMEKTMEEYNTMNTYDIYKYDYYSEDLEILYSKLEMLYKRMITINTLRVC